MFENRCWNDNCQKKEMWCCQKYEKPMPKPMNANCECKFGMKMPIEQYNMGYCPNSKMYY